MGLLAVATFQDISGLPEDRYVNTFAIKTQGDAHTGANLEELGLAIENFYASDQASGACIADYISSRVSRSNSACEIEFYDITGELDGRPHGSPFYFYQWTLPANTGAVALPNEVACVLRFETAARDQAVVEAPDGSDPGTKVDRPKQRNTGRIYLGPLTISAMASSAISGLLDGGFRTTVLQAAQQLAVDVGAIPDSPAVWDLGVWSRADATIRAATHAVVDNAPDTQRRRGLKATVLERVAL